MHLQRQRVVVLRTSFFVEHEVHIALCRFGKGIHENGALSRKVSVPDEHAQLEAIGNGLQDRVVRPFLGACHPCQPAFQRFIDGDRCRKLVRVLRNISNREATKVCVIGFTLRQVSRDSSEQTIPIASNLPFHKVRLNRCGMCANSFFISRWLCNRSG